MGNTCIEKCFAFHLLLLETYIILIVLIRVISSLKYFRCFRLARVGLGCTAPARDAKTASQDIESRARLYTKWSGNWIDPEGKIDDECYSKNLLARIIGVGMVHPDMRVWHCLKKKYLDGI